MKASKIETETVNLLKKKAIKSDCTYKVSAVAFDKKGDVLGHTRNTHSKWDVLEKDGNGRSGTAIHAERRLMERYGENIKTIMIARVGHSGELRPIHPCKSCKKVAEKLGIRIVSIDGTPGTNKKRTPTKTTRFS